MKTLVFLMILVLFSLPVSGEESIFSPSVYFFSPIVGAPIAPDIFIDGNEVNIYFSQRVDIYLDNKFLTTGQHVSFPAQYGKRYTITAVVALFFKRSSDAGCWNIYIPYPSNPLREKRAEYR